MQPHEIKPITERPRQAANCTNAKFATENIRLNLTRMDTAKRIKNKPFLRLNLDATVSDRQPDMLVSAWGRLDEVRQECLKKGILAATQICRSTYSSH
jgi:hypothetical protein